MDRRKELSLPVPASQSEAIEVLAAYRAADRASLVDRIVADAVIGETKRQLAERQAEREAEQKHRFAALKAWWEAGGKEIAGKKRSAELAGASLGVRLSTPAVKFNKGWNAAKVLKWLDGLRWAGKARFSRTKVELDKQAVIKHFAEPEVARTFRTVLDVVQGDEFFIDTGLDEAAIRKELHHDA